MDDKTKHEILESLLYPPGVSKPGEVDKFTIARTVRKLFELARSTFRRPDAMLAVGQLLAWYKLSNEGSWSASKSFMDVQLAPDDFEQSIRQFDELDKHSATQPFYEFGDRLRSLGYNTFVRLVDEIRVCTAKGSVDFNVACDALLSELSEHSIDAFVPDELARFVVSLLGMPAESSLYCPFDGSLRIAVHASSLTSNVYFEAYGRSPLPAVLSILKNGALHVQFGDPIEAPSWQEGGLPRVFEYGAAAPPMGRLVRSSFAQDAYSTVDREKSSYSEFAGVKAVLEQVSNRAVVIVPNSFLFKTSAAETDFKRFIVRNGWLAAVVAVPGNVLSGSAIPCCLLLFDKQRTDRDILLIDATTNDFWWPKARGENLRRLKNEPELLRIVRNRATSPSSKLISVAECETNNYNLSMERYLLSDDRLAYSEILQTRKTKELFRVVEDLIRPQVFKADRDDEVAEVFYEIGALEIDKDGIVRRSSKAVHVPAKTLHKANAVRLRSGDIVLAIKGSVGTVGLISDAASEHNWVPGQSYIVIRPDPAQLCPEALFRYLRSPITQSYLSSRAGGVTVQLIQMKDLRALPVLILTTKEQCSIAERHKEIVALHEQLSKLQQQIISVEQSIWAELGIDGNEASDNVV